ncbi:MAG TPA: hypothetical protein VFD82_09070 [Planctomycetota bacterium]|nr:hypothetical protein [Planctomycetota bacterium]
MSKDILERNLARLLARAYEPVTAPASLRTRCLALARAEQREPRRASRRAGRRVATMLVIAAAWLFLTRPARDVLAFARADGSVVAAGTLVSGRAVPSLTSDAGDALRLEPESVLAVHSEAGADVEVLGGAVLCEAVARSRGAATMRVAVAGSRLSPSPEGCRFTVLLVEDADMGPKSKSWLIGGSALAAGTAAVVVYAGSLQWEADAGGLTLAAGQTALRAPGQVPLAAQVAPPVAVTEPPPPEEARPEPQAPIRTAPPLSADQVRRLLASGERLDQVRAIDLLLQAATAEAAQLLAESLLACNDPVLAALLQEALAKLIGKQPELAQDLAQVFMAALTGSEADPGRAETAISGLAAMGIAAAEPLGAFLANRATAPEAAGRAASVLAELGGEHREVVAQKLRSGLEAALLVFDDPLAQDADRERTRKKTGSLAWLAGRRAAAEHDQLAQVLVDSLLRTGDEPQAGTLVWGLGHLTGVGLPERVRLLGTLLRALPAQKNGGIAQAWVRAAKALSTGVPPEQFAPMIDELASLYANDPNIAAKLTRLRTELGLR